MATLSVDLPAPSTCVLPAGADWLAASLSLLILSLLKSPQQTASIPYPPKRGREPFNNYYQAYRANQGWSGQELLELVNVYLKPSGWRCPTGTLYDCVLPHLVVTRLIRVKARNTPAELGRAKLAHTVGYFSTHSAAGSSPDLRSADELAAAICDRLARRMESRRSNKEATVHDAGAHAT